MNLSTLFHSRAIRRLIELTLRTLVGAIAHRPELAKLDDAVRQAAIVDGAVRTAAAAYGYQLPDAAMAKVRDAVGAALIEYQLARLTPACAALVRMIEAGEAKERARVARLETERNAGAR